MKYIPFPDKKYNIIYADPPWSYKDKALAGNRGAVCKYKVQEKYWINNLPVKSIADKDCSIFLWVTMPKLKECWELIEKWGFIYKTLAFSSWTRENAEICLFAIKGKPKIINSGVNPIIDTPIERHSKKSDETKKRIIKLLGDLPRIELFARKKTEGWDAWGNEV